MSFFSSKRKQKPYTTKFETEIDKKDSSRNVGMQGNFPTTPNIGVSEFMSNPGSMKDQIKHLNAYINEFAIQNERLQNVVDDCKTTIIVNKQMLNDYVNQINSQAEEIDNLKSENK